MLVWLIRVHLPKWNAIRFSTLEANCRELDCQPGDLLGYRPE
jgi:putative transcriptional regulator